ncbi:uncharacterized protein [Dermacentor andersoni]|uniref:uncharacterized protein isoform X2 n=1 Tax=Dermacentor andersoni TaxID=34620 RepID=UPI0024160C69|nr:uncharacterized protein LOC129384379 isoform X2 [Dermacentor andersoni]
MKGGMAICAESPTCDERKKQQCNKLGQECKMKGGMAICAGTSTCDESRKQQCNKMGQECKIKGGMAICVGKERPTCDERRKELCKKIGQKCKIQGGLPICVGCTRSACVTACKKLDSKKPLLDVICIGKGKCKCLYQDDCTQERCQKFCVENLTLSWLKSAKCKGRVCHCNPPNGIEGMLLFLAILLDKACTPASLQLWNSIHASSFFRRQRADEETAAK